MPDSSSPFRAAAFLDRDGTIVRDTGYLRDPATVELLPGAAAAVRTLNSEGVAAVLVSNQSGVARGLVTPEQMDAVQARVAELLAAEGARLDAAYFCTAHPDADDPRRKPGVGMHREALRDLPIRDLPACAFGDKVSDVQFGLKAGMRACFVATGETPHEEFLKWHRKLDAQTFAGRVASAHSLREGVDAFLVGLSLLRVPGDGVLAKKLHAPDRLARALDNLRPSERIVFANGCFDLIHGGHVSYLEDAKARGTLLVVGVNSDASMRRLKGEGRPVMPEPYRLQLLAAMECVDALVPLTDDTAEYLLRTLRPQVHAKGSDYTAETVPEREVARGMGIEVLIAGSAKENSTKDIVRTVRERA
ncbi:MAG: HAD-IIIA family hydrolase [Candidatus Sumerlaeia bacterium]|nr:HAD-IIIA family hydrolase [Candidatus Sumerlaeia bacterium]